MKKHYWILLALCVVGWCNPVAAEESEQKEITSEYIINASFESDDPANLTVVNNSADGLRGYTLAQPEGWEVEGTGVTQLLVTPDCYADNNFGLITQVSEGNLAYYLRMGWSTGNTTIKQVLKGLPKGNYLLTVDHRTGYVNNATSSIKISVASEGITENFNQGSTNFFTTAKWNTTVLPFVTDIDGDVELAFSINWLSGGSCVMIDNIRLYELEGEYIAPEDPTETDLNSFTEGVITHDFVDEAKMKSDLMQMLADFSLWMKNDFQLCTYPNSIGEDCGCFKGESTMNANEQGVRPNADLSMICAFLVKYGQGKVDLPKGVTWEDLKTLAKKSLIFAYSTHKANKLKVCSNGGYWGSTSTGDYVWESSLWAMSVAYSAFFQWETLSEEQRGYIEAMLVAECNYELHRSVPTGYSGDTKAEENGWETNVLAATLGLFPNHELAPQWFDRLREFAINCYSHPSDATDNTVIDPEYDLKTVSDFYKGQNLYNDYTLQNHNLFHTSYQNVVMQELGESALALKMFQLGLHGTEKWKTNALMHNNKKVMEEVLDWLALADGELAMPNGNDWSLFLYDQITSYTTMACFMQDEDALMLENMAYKNIQARQKTTTDGAWLLRADVGARRMGVEAHRVMMTWLMHEILPTEDLTPTDWGDFNSRHAEAKILESQNVVRASTDDRFTCFSWSTGLNSYTGYFAANNPDKNKIVVPYRSNNTGNFLGWYTVNGRATNATPIVKGNYDLRGNAWIMNGELNTNDAALNNRFAIYSTPGNAIIYVDYVRAKSAVTITKEQGGLMAVSVDEFTRTARTLYTKSVEKDKIIHKQLDGSKFATFDADWINIDNEIGILSHGNKQMAFGDKGNNNSIMTAKLYPLYSDESRSFNATDVVDKRNVVYYSNVSAEQTDSLNARLILLTDSLPRGWNGLIAPDPDGSYYLLLSNFVGILNCTINNVQCQLGAPVFSVPTTIAGGGSSATYTSKVNHSIGDVLRVFVKGTELIAMQVEDDSCAVYLLNVQDKDVISNASVVLDTKVVCGDVSIASRKCVKVYVEQNELRWEDCVIPEALLPNMVEMNHRQETKSPEWVDVYSLDGMRIRNHVAIKSATLGLPKGVYVIEGKKVIVE